MTKHRPSLKKQLYAEQDVINILAKFWPDVIYDHIKKKPIKSVRHWFEQNVK